MRASSTAFRSGAGLSRGVLIWSVLFLVFVVLMGIAFYKGSSRTGEGAAAGKLGSDLTLLVQRMTLDGPAAAAGDGTAMQRLQREYDGFSEGLLSLSAASSSGALTQGELDSVNTAWADFGAKVQTILTQRDAIGGNTQALEAARKLLPGLRANADSVADSLRSSLAPNSQLFAAFDQLSSIERIDTLLLSLQAGVRGGDTAVTELVDAAKKLGFYIDSLAHGSGDRSIKQVTMRTAQDALGAMAEMYPALDQAVNQISAATAPLTDASLAAAELPSAGDVVIDRLSSLGAGFASDLLPKSLGANPVLVFAGLAFLSFTALVYTVYSQTRRQLDATKGSNKKNQEAILKLLDEMSTLAEGDLTVEATVTEDITGAIADSVNYAVEAMRQLVQTINHSSSQVEATARATQGTTAELAESSQEQAHLISSVSRSIEELNRSIDKVSQNAEDSAEVADVSVTIAHKGVEIVRSNIEGMDLVREKIQETSKRIKRLGESSQEIGDIVGLITDIADQTNILALNAAIQASAAGEGGRGFAVVADEVQRLAERSANASKQIEALVKTIQADTSEAVQSMEQTTSNVVRGATLAEDSGKALAEIETVSRRLAGLVGDISVEAREQSLLSDKVTQLMNSIQRITGQTVASTNDAAAAVGELVEQAAFLKQSVEGFKLSDGFDQVDTGIIEINADERNTSKQGQGGY